MTRVTFTRDFAYRPDALTTVRYLAGRAYPVPVEVEQSAREAGALKENNRARSGSSRRKSGTGAFKG